MSPVKSREGYVLCQQLLAKGVIAGTTLRTRNGGDFSLACRRASPMQAYESNLKAWTEDFSLEKHYADGRIFFLQPVHGKKVLYVDETEALSHRSDSFVPECDGLITGLFGEESVVLTVKTADCLPIFLFDPATKASGIVHCGWRGLQQGALLNALDAMCSKAGVSAQNLMLHIGPGITESRYEVGAEVALLFPESASKQGDRWFLNLADAACRQARTRGLLDTNISRSEYCTYDRQDLFFSYRRSGRGGLMLSFITVPD